MMIDEKMIIVSPKHSQNCRLTFWGYDFCGYTDDLRLAGKYSEAIINQKRPDIKKFSGKLTQNIDYFYCTEKELLEKIATRTLLIVEY